MTNQLGLALQNYQTALSNLEKADTPSIEQILHIVISRDRLQKLLSKDNQDSAAFLISVLELDKRLKKQEQRITQVVDLGNWRASFNPPKEAWWWFLSTTKLKSQLDSLLERYDNALKYLEETIKKSSSVQSEQLLVQKILAVLITRDALQKQLEEVEASTEILLRLSELDSLLRKQITVLPEKVNPKVRRYILTQLEDIRKVSNPSSKLWWWFPNIPVYFWDKYDSIWDTLTLIWLATIFSLFADIASRFLSGGVGLGIFGSFAVIFQSILALAGGGALTKTGREAVEETLKHWGIPRHWWQETKFGAASLLLLFFIGFRLYLPRIAVKYNNIGFQDYQKGQLDSAESKYKRAIELNPNYTQVHYNLGILYEDLQDLKQAQIQYSLAVQSGFPPANNNLARLYILSKKVPVAVNLLLKGIYQLENEQKFRQIKGKEQVQYSLLKNLGWARLNQERYEEAKDALEAAITIENIPKQAAAYCLLSQALEKLDNKQETWQKALVNCLQYPINRNNPEEDEWVYQAQQKMKTLKSSLSK